MMTEIMPEATALAKKSHSHSMLGVLGQACRVSC